MIFLGHHKDVNGVLIDSKTSFGTLHSDLNELSGFSVGETSACLWGQLWGQLVNHSATRGQVSIGLAGN